MFNLLIVAKCQLCEDNYRLEELEDGYCEQCFEYTL